MTFPLSRHQELSHLQFAAANHVPWIRIIYLDRKIGRLVLFKRKQPRSSLTKLGNYGPIIIAWWPRAVVRACVRAICVIVQAFNLSASGSAGSRKKSRMDYDRVRKWIVSIFRLAFTITNTLSTFTEFIIRPRRISLLFGSWIRVVSKQRIFLGRNVSICGVDYLCSRGNVSRYHALLLFGVWASMWCTDIPLLNNEKWFVQLMRLSLFSLPEILKYSNRAPVTIINHNRLFFLHNCITHN